MKSLTAIKCRVCKGNFFDKPLLSYNNMPKVAQFLPDKSSLGEDKGISLVICQCSACGLVQLSNEAVPYYKEVIRASAFSDEMMKYRKKQFTEFTGKYSLVGKKVVEIGCGKGEYLSIIGGCGTKAYGIENSTESVTFCIANGLNVVRGFIDNEGYRIVNGTFSAFFILSYLEHLPDPNSTLRGICSSLDDEGVGIVEVPNFDMIIAKNLFSEFTSDHLFYFTKETLNSTLNINGFEIIECKSIWHDYIISAVVRKRKSLDLGCFNDCREKMNRQINDFISCFKPGQVAIWGAGHQAFAVMTLVGLGGKIRYVVDSAPFKQGKFTPATHIPIVPPETLNTDPVDAIIVIAASYSDEVAKIIRRDYRSDIRVAILRENELESV